MTDLSKLSDRELLELAAEAAGLEYHWVKVQGGHLLQASEPGSREEETWNPLRIDGDALRLGVTLDLLSHPRMRHERDVLMFTRGMDKLAATCRAITLAAAAIALAKRGKQ